MIAMQCVFKANSKSFKDALTAENLESNDVFGMSDPPVAHGKHVQAA